MVEENVRQQIIDLEAKRCEALTSGDVATLDALMADDLVHVHGNGHMDNRAAYLDGVANKYKFHRIKRGELRVRAYGDTAVVNGTISQAVSVNGIDKINEVDGVVTQTWVRGDKGWQQSTCHMHFLTVNGKSLL